MPELPEVETTLRGIAPHLQDEIVSNVIIRNASLRWPIPKNLPKLLRNHTVRSLQRRAKYILVAFDHGTLILHLGMSGSLRILPHGTPPEKHDHFDLVLSNGELMRLRDPRRFGAVLWHEGEVMEHALLKHLGPEPLTVGAASAAKNLRQQTGSYNIATQNDSCSFDADYLYQAIRKRSAPIKLAIMDSQLVVGVGNIYANEALFRAGIKPQLAANKVSRARCERLVQTIKEVLREAIKQGGSSLRDFIHSDGSSGYFQQHYFVYARKDEACKRCSNPIKHIKQGQRSSFYCPQCQK